MRYANNFNQALNGRGRLNYVWLNVNKFGKDSGVGKPDQAVLDNEVRYFNVLADELDILKPDVCIFFSGPNYDADIQKKLPDVQFHEFGGYGLNKVARLSSRHLPKHAFRVYHPGYGNRIADTYSAILTAIVEECKR